ncbi:Multidrug resistance protein fnx1 [Escovopsis weberi]|uniref:Multidrug resistance protein fnx1 n=1 Tax=Escovopsis weberi TaxID=150374 RepID=A0A0M8MXG2_ESCWE|nr:Multidrug resistance protein fnx1 [Escovopsis weberi]
MPGERYGHQTEADPRFIHPVVAVGERAPLLGDSRRAGRSWSTSASAAGRGNSGGGGGGGDGDDEVAVAALVEEMSTARVMLIVGTCWIGVFLGAVDSTIIATLSGPIASEFNSLSLMSWLATSYFICTAAVQPISGRLTDVFGRGPGLLLSNVLFAGGNLICGLSSGPRAMILGRVVAGLGGGGLMSITTFLCSDLVPLRRRGLVQGIGNLFWGSGSLAGGVLGGLLQDHTSLKWRLAFLLMVPPALVSAVLVALLVRVPPKQSDKSYLSRIDFAGVLLIITSLVLLLLGLNAGGNLVPWTHPLPLASIPLALAGFAAFFWWETAVAQPIIPVRLMVSRTVLSACLCNFFSTMATMALLFYIPLYLQVRGNSVTRSGLMVLPTSLGSALGAFTTGWIMSKTGTYRTLSIATLVAFVAGYALLTLQTESSGPWLTEAATFIAGLGYGSMLTTTLLACVASVDHSQQAVVTSASYLYRSVGGTLGITTAAAVYQNILKDELWRTFGDEPGAAEIIQRIRDNLDELQHLPEGWREGVNRAFMDAFGALWTTLLWLAVGGLVSVCFMQQHKLHSTLSRR